MTIGDLLSKKRKELGLTLADVGKSVGVSKATVSRWESGDIHKMKRDKIASLSATLSIDPLVFLSSPEILSSQERELLQAYRSADIVTRNNIRKMLDLPLEKGESSESSAM